MYQITVCPICEALPTWTTTFMTEVTPRANCEGGALLPVRAVRDGRRHQSKQGYTLRWVGRMLSDFAPNLNGSVEIAMIQVCEPFNKTFCTQSLEPLLQRGRLAFAGAHAYAGGNSPSGEHRCPHRTSASRVRIAEGGG